MLNIEQIKSYNRVVALQDSQQALDRSELLEQNYSHIPLTIASKNMLEYKEAFLALDINATDFTPAVYTNDDAKKKLVVPYVVKTKALFPDTQIEPDLNLKLDFRFGQVLGIILGDGWWDKKDYNNKERCLYISDLKGYNAEYVISYVKEIIAPENFNVNSRTDTVETNPSKYGTSVKYTMNFKGSTKLTQWLTFNFGGERSDASAGSKNKYLSEWVLSAPLEFQLGILVGLVSTDGGIHANMSLDKPRLGISVSSTSVNLIKGLGKICENLGIKYRNRFDKLTTRNNQAYSFIPSAVDCRLVNAFDNIADLDKRSVWLSTVVDTEKSKMFDNICVPKFVSDELDKFIYKGKLSSYEYLNDELKSKIKNIVHKGSVIYKTKLLGVCSRSTANCFLNLEKELNNFRQEAFIYLVTRIEGLLNSKEAIDTEQALNYLRLLVNICIPLTPTLNETKVDLRNDLLGRIKSLKFRLANKQNSTSLKTFENIYNILKLEGPYVLNIVKNSEILKTWEDNIINNYHINWDVING